MTIERHAPKGSIVISKADAAERQLRTAVWLFFHDMDSISIHGLASSAMKVLWRLHEKHGTGYRGLQEMMIEDHVKPEFKKDIIDVFNETANFIKHSDRDPFSFHRFNPEINVFLLMDACNSLRSLNGNNPIETQALQVWMMIEYPTIFKREDAQIAKAITLGEELRGTFNGKAEFYSLYYKAAQQGLAVAAIKYKPSNLPTSPDGS